MHPLASRVERLGSEALLFAVLRGLTLVGGMAALVVVPLATEHRLHLVPLLGGFIAYKLGLLAVVLIWPERAREMFLTTLAADLAIVFLLVWFTGGGGSHFYLLFYPLVALHAYYFGPAIGVTAAVVASGLLAVANALVAPPTAWPHIASRAALLGLIALALGYVAARERQAREHAERLNEEMRVTMARLARAEQLAAVGRLSAKMAHEVRSPLGAINLNVDMLRDIVGQCPGVSMAEATDLLQEIRTEVRALADLTDEYLVASRLPQPRLEKESLNDVVAEVIGFLEPLASRQDVILEQDLGTALPPIALDAAMVKQAIRNLVKNAIEMLPHGGRIAVRTRCEHHAVTVAVTDDGPGVAPEAAGHLFEPFFTTKSRGTGLGLSIAREIARQHGGDVEHRDTSGRGAEFLIRLPLGNRDNG